MATHSTLDEDAVTEPFDDFFRRDYRSVLGLAISLTGDRWAAEDLTQEGFVAAEQQWERVARLERPGAWVRRVVANKAVSWYRHNGAESRALRRMGRTRPVENEPALSAAVSIANAGMGLTMTSARNGLATSRWRPSRCQLCVVVVVIPLVHVRSFQMET